jgi:hypothetical protein
MARPIRICRSGNPPPGGVSPVCPAPGTNGEVLVAAAGVVLVVLDDAELEVNGVVGVVGGVVVGVVGGVVVGVVGGVVGGVVVGVVGGVVGGVVVGVVGGVVGGVVVGVGHGPWLRLNVPLQPS